MLWKQREREVLAFEGEVEGVVFIASSSGYWKNKRKG
jgi:hypothetical protein